MTGRRWKTRLFMGISMLLAIIRTLRNEERYRLRFASEVVASEVKKSIFDGCATRLGVSVLSGNRLPLGVPILSEYCLSYLD